MVFASITRGAQHGRGSKKKKAKSCCWFTPPLPWDGGIARTAIQVHAINLIELGRGKSGSPFRTSRGCKLPTGSPTTNKEDCHWWVPKVASYDMLGEQLHYSNPVKHGEAESSLIVFSSSRDRQVVESTRLPLAAASI